MPLLNGNILITKSSKSKGCKISNAVAKKTKAKPVTLLMKEQQELFEYSYASAYTAKGKA